MKKLLALVLALAMALCFASCGSEDETAVDPEDTSTEISLIVDGDIDDGGFNQITWECIQNFCTERGITCGYFIPKKTDDEAIEKTVHKSIKNGGKLIIFAGSTFETAVYDLQKEDEKTCFYLIDGVPHDEDNNYDQTDNSIGVLFAEEEAGYLAGYAAVKDGYKKLGFMGGEKLPSVKRYGYGFLQGVSAAASEQGIEKKIQIKYTYTGTFSASNDIMKQASEWYGDGTEVIFSCGGGIVKSVIQAAETAGGKVIGVDVDQSGLSECVITSAKKGIDSALDDVLKEYARGNFIGNNVFKYSASNGGVGLEIDNARFNTFDQAQYDAIFEQIKEGSIKIKKDTEVDKIKDLVNKKIKIEKE
ncbi:MAG: BMP family ABC transporter substrate-binding protein [Firmicutes bacterium]|nr:BMP family ABC transporter substrate-binding protein [Bacillota bacterium]